MITLSSPATITPPPFTLADGTLVTPDSITFSTIDYVVRYDSTAEFCRANLKGLNLTITLWKGADYESAGNWTDADTDARLLSLLGSNPSEILQALYPKPPNS